MGEESQHVEYLRLPQTKHTKAVQLFLHDGHYSVIVLMSKLTNADMKRRRYHFCPYCPYKHRTEGSLRAHIEGCAVNELTQVEMPEEGECLHFKKWEWVLRGPYTIYADFECRLVKENTKKGEHTVQTQVYVPIGHCYHLVSDVDPAENLTVQYTAKTNDEDVSLHFVRSVYDLTIRLGQKHSKPKPI